MAQVARDTRAQAVTGWRSDATRDGIDATRANLTTGQLFSTPGGDRWWARSQPEWDGLCSIGNSPIVRAPRTGTTQLSARVAIGIMAGDIHGYSSKCNRWHCQHGLLERATATWLPQAPWASVLVMHHCPSPERSVPMWLNGTASRIVWRCFAPRPRGGRITHGANYPKLANLLRELLSSLPAHDIYVKIDLDTLLVPANLVHVLRRVPTERPLYFGSIEATELLGRTHAACGSQHSWSRCDHRDFTRKPPQLRPPTARDNSTSHLQQRNGTAPRGHARVAWAAQAFWSKRARAASRAWLPSTPECERLPFKLMSRLTCSGPTTNAIQYVQGSFEGMTRSALQRLVASDCIMRVGAQPSCFHPRDCIHEAEDATLGICMHEHGVPLWQCPCFHPTGPCEVFNPTTCLGRLCAAPLSVHKLKMTTWYDGWWKLLTA